MARLRMLSWRRHGSIPVWAGTGVTLSGLRGSAWLYSAVWTCVWGLVGLRPVPGPVSEMGDLLGRLPRGTSPGGVDLPAVAVMAAVLPADIDVAWRGVMMCHA
jgi:hypothetical protein